MSFCTIDWYTDFFFLFLSSFVFFLSEYFFAVSFFIGYVYHVTMAGSQGGQLKCDNQAKSIKQDTLRYTRGPYEENDLLRSFADFLQTNRHVLQFLLRTKQTTKRVCTCYLLFNLLSNLVQGKTKSNRMYSTFTAHLHLPKQFRLVTCEITGVERTNKP